MPAFSRINEEAEAEAKAIEDDVLLGALAHERHGFHAVYRQAEAYRERLGRSVPEGIAATLVDIYNRRAKSGRRLTK